MMKRVDCFRILAQHVKDEIVVATYSAAGDWVAIADRPLNHFAWGAMGLASSHGLGLALAFPGRKIIVLDGDGSLLMNLGSPVTIAGVAPKNLIHFVCQNDSYEANGGHPLPRCGVDFAGMAHSAGIPVCTTFDELSDFEARLGKLLTIDGPVFAVLKIEHSEARRIDYADLYRAERRDALRAALRRQPTNPGERPKS